MMYSRWERTRIFTGSRYSVEVYRLRNARTFSVTVVPTDGTWSHIVATAETARAALSYVRKYAI